MPHHDPAARLLPSSRERVLERCRNKKVLRVAITDTRLPRERVRSSRWLNQHLYEAADQLWNVYIDDAGLEFNTRDQTIDALHVADAGQIGAHHALARQRFDVIVAFELLEQLRSPGAFLDSVKSLMQPAETELVICVPNRRSASSLRVAHDKPEISSGAITKLVREHGLRVERTYLAGADSAPSRRLRRLAGLPARFAARAICRIVPYLSGGVFVVATRPWP